MDFELINIFTCTHTELMKSSGGKTGNTAALLTKMRLTIKREAET